MDYEASKKSDECFLITELFTRRLVFPVARAAVAVGLTPNVVTLIGGLAWVVSAPLVVIGGEMFRNGNAVMGWTAWLVSAALWQTGVIMDVADGSVARMTGSSSLAGAYLDFVFHLVFNPMYLAALGVGLFLFSDHLPYLLLAILSVCANWGASFSAKEHVLCEAVAKGQVVPYRLPPDVRYRVFVDSQAMKQSAAGKCRSRDLLVHLAKEILFFPGQYALFSLAMIGDAALWACGRHELLAMQFTFVLVSGTCIVRVPFRVHREFRALLLHDAVLRATTGSPAGPVPGFLPKPE